MENQILEDFFVIILLTIFMGQQLSLTTQMPQATDRSLSFYAQPLSQRSNCSQGRLTKTITVGSIEELNLLKEIFDFRLKNREYLIHCYGFQVLNIDKSSTYQKFSCKSPLSSIKINFHYQKITTKFSNLYQISVNQGLKILAHCLKGFSLLYNQFGYFVPQSNHISKQGDEWKVWISQNVFALKSKSESKNGKNKISKQKFLQQVVHLFDVLRDQENPDFSYSVFIYGKTNIGQNLPNLQLSQILGKLNQTILLQKSVNNHRVSLRRLTLTSSETVRKFDCNTLISFDDRTNDATLSKFNNTKDKNANKSFSQCNSMKESNKQKQNSSFTNTQCMTTENNFHRFRKNSLSNHFGQRKFGQSNELSNFKRVSSKLIQGALTNDTAENEYSNYLKNKSSTSTPSNCTGWTKNMTPLKILSSNLKEIAMKNGNFIKKQRSYTMDLPHKTNTYNEQQMEQPLKITENSQVNSDSEQEEYRNKNFDQAFLQSQASIQKMQQGQQQGPVQIVSKNPTSNTPSIAKKTKHHGKQTMKFLKQYLNNSKNSHKRSLTDHANLDQEHKKVKYCWSQEFDSQFFSLDSKKENTIPSKLQLNYEESSAKQNPVEQQSNEDESSMREEHQKKIKRVKIADDSQIDEYNYNKDSDYVCQKSRIQDTSDISREASIAKLPIFKSQGGFKGLLGNNRLNTLKSIKQIEVDLPIDEEILNDLNKMFTKHRFAKSTKFTQ